MVGAAKADDGPQVVGVECSMFEVSGLGGFGVHKASERRIDMRNYTCTHNYTYIHTYRLET